MAASGFMNNYQLFPASYFSGTDVYVSLNGQVFDDVVFVEFSMVENLMPVYGYMSYTYDAVAHGTRLVQGRIGVNFTSSGRLFALLNKVEEDVSSGPSTRPYEGLAAQQDREATINWIKGKPRDEIKNMAENLEAQIWGENLSLAGSSVTRKETRPFYTPVGGTLHQRGFDMVISYGSENLQTAYGYDISHGAVTILNNCHLYGQSQRIAMDNGNIVEVYQFIAKDINNSVK